ncbi:class I SAM-dependent methyltransferase [Cylindrospermum sp. FACHB-282]|uniref:class I SAM-dependent methyltransferase n=1 Tax=Cylindrospermum sp. FACHB-282 TaxID=2692794 RepID=UPI001688D463|nr:methyltransferase domain-containing protein [Cylindrospermum sp. FACHB-282]MBD2385983.1 methyltransferase domain-containing protein [Cylindrospermum sp. FACHB-282]
MASCDSYDANLKYRGWDAEIERLQAQALLSWEQEARLLNWLGLQNGMSLLELGSGPGFVTGKLLSLLPNSSITSVEIDPKMHKRAKQHLGDSGLNRLTQVEASVMNMCLPEQHYDFAIARLIFQHLSNPIEAAKEVLHVLKPGGKLAIIDLDAALWGIVEPYIPELQTIYAKSTQAQTARKGNQFIGRQLWRILQSAGYTNLQLEAFVYHSDALGLEPFISQMNPDRLLPAVWVDCVSLEEFATAHVAYQRFLKSPDAYVLMLGLIACGERPTNL